MTAKAKESLTPPPALAAPPMFGLTMFTEHDVAGLTRLSRPTLQKLRRLGSGPRWVRVGTAVRYPAADVAAWLDTLTN